MYERFVPQLLQEYGWTPEEWLEIESNTRGAHKITNSQYLDMIESYKERLKALEAA